jgi:ABC-type proline/glycine betaine transport system ATPase subunit
MDEVFDLFPRLMERRSQLAGTLSGGERQMLAMGRALMAKPKLLMLDEPSLGLAPLIIKEIFRIIAELKQTGVAILLVEQNARAALQVADYGYVLETGELSLEGPTRDLLTDPRVVESYLGLGGRRPVAQPLFGCLAQLVLREPAVWNLNQRPRALRLADFCARHLFQFQPPEVHRLRDQNGLAAVQAAIGIDDVEYRAERLFLHFR